MKMCIFELESPYEGFLLGTYRHFDEPNSGGVFRFSPDTSWQYLGLSGHRVRALREFENLPGQLFAATDSGIYVSADHGQSWSFVTASLFLYEFWDFVVSPIDSAKWIAAANFRGDGYIDMSTDAGRTWEVWHPGGEFRELTFSATMPNTLYCASGWVLLAMDVSDTLSVSEVYYLPNSEDLMSIRRHPSEPWLYLLGIQRVIRYDESTGDVRMLVIPESLGWGWDLDYADGFGPIFGTTQGGVFLTDDDLASLTPASESAPIWYGGQALYASSTRWIAVFGLDSLYCKAPPSSTVHQTRKKPVVSILPFPNPAQEAITFALPIGKELEIYNVLGQRLFRLDSPQGNLPLTIPVASWPAGTYFYRIRDPFLPIYRAQNGRFQLSR